jgi:hypothetical protein
VAAEPEQPLEPEPEPQSEDAATKWAKFAAGADLMLARLQGIPVSTAPAVPKWNPFPSRKGPTTYTAEQLAWIGRRDRATYFGQQFDEPTPPDMLKELH